MRFGQGHLPPNRQLDPCRYSLIDFASVASADISAHSPHDHSP